MGRCRSLSKSIIMPNKATTETKQWEQARSRLLEYTDKHKAKDQLSAAIFDVMSECPLTKDCVAGKGSKKSSTHNTPEVSGAEQLGLDSSDITKLLKTFPGNWLESLSYTNSHSLDPRAQSTGKRSCVTVTPSSEDLVSVKVYNPYQSTDCSSDIICHGCLQAYSTAHFPHKISKKMVDSIAHAVDSINSHEFHVTHKDKLHKTGRNHSETHKDNQAALWSSLVQTAYEAPFYSDRQDWQCATQKALMGMQYLTLNEAEIIVEALSGFFEELDPAANLNNLIRQYQNQVVLIESKILAHNIATIFTDLSDTGLKSFFDRWIKHSTKDNQSALPEIHHRHTPSLRAGMALDGAKELGSNLATSLRVEQLNPKDKRQVVNNLKANVRRFNDIWTDLDKSEQKFLRPKLLQIVHTSIV
jgi:hypothetical protein